MTGTCDAWQCPKCKRFWPTGPCLVCDLEAEVGRLREAAQEYLDATDDTCTRGYCVMDDGENVHPAKDCLRAALGEG